MSVSPAAHPERFNAEAFAPPSSLGQLQGAALTAGALGLVASLYGLYASPDYFFRAYLVGWVFCVGIAFGSLALAMLHHLSGGAWGLAVRRQLEAATRTLPWLLLATLPLFYGLRHVYAWASPAKVQIDPILTAKSPYLNPAFFIGRTLLYFAIALTLTYLLNRMSAAQDETADPTLVRRMRVVSGPGLVIYCLAITFAAVDWLMSIEAHWSSTMYGFYLIASQALAALTFNIVIAFYLSRREPMERVFEKKHFHDYGKLFFAINMLWTYFCFSQFLITWSGNLPDEVFWYRHRILGGWGYVAMAVVLLHFALPYALLLSRDIKRRPRLLATIAAWMLLMRLVDLFWQVEPSYVDNRHLGYYWLYAAVPLALFGFWLYLFLGELKKRPLMPFNDPHLAEHFAHE
ncbi:MAG TPA: hypothetical protein VHR45_11950 [Thermoanaerobaculia bacterium]|nr:hypothetical protein [Thermoanaerobaculia bacterium]